MTQRNKNILMTLLIIAPFVVTFAFVRLFVDLNDMDRVNKGTMLLPHVQLTDLAARKPSGDFFSAADTLGHWSLVYIGDGDCDDACKNALFYLIRQLRLSLGADSKRVERVIMTTAPAGEELRQFLDENVQGMTELSVSKESVSRAFSQAFPSSSDALGKIYIMSPDGQLILWYPSHTEQQQVLLEADNILADLKRILKGAVNG